MPAQSFFSCIFSASSHSLMLIMSRAALMRDRVRLCAVILSALMLLWIPVDIALLGSDTASGILAARGAAAVFLIVLIFLRPPKTHAFFGKLYFALLLSVPMMFFCYANLALAGVEWTEQNIFIKSAYAHFPVLVVMLLCFFPLTVLESLLFGGALIFFTYFAALNNVAPAAMLLELGTLWILCVVTVIVAVSSVSQLHFMSKFVDFTTHDEMTGCLRRDYGETLLETIFDMSQRRKVPLSLLFVDLDNFKKVNDNFGHDEGDRVLAAAGAALPKNTAQTGCCYPVGRGGISACAV
ncbi:MAG: GGDEF domain-containing protein [Alphaproteobacteria bacterium]|nr:MAG: GGDEF domain-containing protein [Alphaproteobacteria bacterium]